MKILVVDDDPVILDLLSTVLHQEGHLDVQCAPSGQAALDIIHTSQEVFDTLILDIQMPEMDGIALCRNIRKNPAYRSTPIIMLTAKTDTRSIEGAFSVGANDYITKPFDVKCIGRRVQIAERMIRDHCKVVPLEDCFDPSLDLAVLQGFDVTEPVRICGLVQHTDPFSLGNYLSQLTKQKLCEVSVFALKLADLDVLRNELSDRDMLLLLAEVSNAISTVVKDERLLNAYIGSGTFICLGNNNILDVWSDLEPQIEWHLKQSRKVRDLGLTRVINVLVSRPFSPNANKGQRVKAAFDRAVSQINRRVKANRLVG